MHPALHAIPALCCIVVAIYLAGILLEDVRTGAVRLRSREAAEGIFLIGAATAGAIIAGGAVLAWAFATGAAR